MFISPLVRTLAPYFGATLVILGFVLWIRGMRHDIAKLSTENSQLKRDIATETDARKRDVSALTTLSEGLANAAVTTHADNKVLTETIDAAHPTPSSPALAAFLAGLRTNDVQGGTASTPSGARR